MLDNSKMNVNLFRCQRGQIHIGLTVTRAAFSFKLTFCPTEIEHCKHTAHKPNANETAKIEIEFKWFCVGSIVNQYCGIESRPILKSACQKRKKANRFHDEHFPFML